MSIGPVATPSGERAANAEEIATKDAAELQDIDDRREIRRGQFKRQAEAAIAAHFGEGAADFPLVWKEINQLAQTILAVNAIFQPLIAYSKNPTPANLTALNDAIAANQPAIDAAQALLVGEVLPIRTTESTASGELDAAGTDTQITPAARRAEIDAVPDVTSRLTP